LQAPGGGGGGGGYFGGGGGGGGGLTGPAAGGGGSSFGPGGATFMNPVRVGNGLITVSYAATDSTPPVTTITLDPVSPNGSSGWYTSEVGVVVAATDSDSGVFITRCALDPAIAPTSYSDLPGGACPTSVSGGGTHTIYAASEDNANNTEAPVSQTLKIDSTPPTVTCPSPAPVFTQGDTASITATVSDATSGSAASTVSAPAPTSTVGTNTVSLAGYDLAGNQTIESCAYTVASNHPPVAEAGPDQTVNSGAGVTLDGSGSADPDGDPVTYLWTQTSGPSVTLSGPSTATPSFTAPAASAMLTFQLQVCDTHSACSTDSVAINVRAPYTILGFFSPAPKSKWKVGATVPVKVALALNGVRISDADAAALLSPCRVFFSAGSTPAVPPTCMKYDSIKHEFVYNWKIATGTTAPATIPIMVTVKNADGTPNNSLSEPINLTK
jgi:hypothetical protein